MQDDDPDQGEPLYWLLVIVASVVIFFVGLALVRLIAWVIQGFTRK